LLLSLMHVRTQAHNHGVGIYCHHLTVNAK